MRRRAVLALVSSPAGLALAVRMASWAAVLPVLKRALPLPALARLMWSAGSGERRREREEAVVRLARSLYRVHPSRSRDNCLERSLLAYRFLARANADPRLVVAVGRGGDGVLGHAWVLVDGHPVFESASALRGYAPIVAYGAAGAAIGAEAERG